MKREVKIEVAAKLRDLMETEGTSWVRPWVSTAGNRNARTGRSYRGVNVFLTGLAAMSNSYASPFWNTYKGWRAMGYQVAKGERGTDIVFWKRLNVKDRETGETKAIPFARWYSVFNADQLTEAYVPKVVTALPEGVTPHDAADALIEATGATIEHGGDHAFYSPANDAIQLPPRAAFKSTDGYYATAFHELGHWTGHETRLNRALSGWFGAPAYAFEELIAEITAALVCVETGVTPEPRADHARYLNGWMRGLADKPDAVLRAFSAAQKAADYLLATQGEAEEPAEIAEAA